MPAGLASTGPGGLLGPAARLLGAVGGDTGDDHATVGAGGGHRGLDYLGALLGGEGLVLAERAVADHAVAAVLAEPGDVLAVAIEVDGAVGGEGQGGRGENPAPGGGGHESSLGGWSQ